MDSPHRDQRLALLEVCRRHVADDGAVLLERFEPDWVRDPADSDGSNGLVGLEFRVLARRGATFDAAITYRVGDRSWTQTFTSAAVDDDELARDAEQCDLHIDRWLDDRRTWALLRPRS